MSLPARRFSRTIAAVDLLLAFNPEERFEFGLDLLIAGLEKFQKTARRQAPSRTELLS